MHSKKNFFSLQLQKHKSYQKKEKKKKRKLQKEKENFPYIGRIIPSKYLSHISWKSNKKQER